VVKNNADTLNGYGSWTRQRPVPGVKPSHPVLPRHAVSLDLQRSPALPSACMDRALFSFSLAVLVAAWLPCHEVWVRSAFAQPQVKSKDTSAPWVLLRNGQVLQGTIHREGDRYRVNLADDGVVVLPRQDIWRIERSLRDLYTFRRQETQRRGGRAHFELSQWCLDHGFFTEAEKHLAIAQRTTADLQAEQVQDLQRRIEVAVSDQRSRTVVPSVPIQPVAATIVEPAASSSRTEVTNPRMAPVALQRFTTRIQPLLVNRCGNATCHGRATQTAFQLARPQRRGPHTARITQRNAVATERLVNFAAPGDSDLLLWSARPHGALTAAPLSQDQIQSVRQWLEMATGSRFATARATQNRATTQRAGGGLINPLAGNADLPRSETDASDESTVGDHPHPALHSSHLPRGDQSGSDGQAGSDGSRDERPTTDPFDPDVFNRQVHPPGQTPGQAP
jgi:hypothetical protein